MFLSKADIVLLSAKLNFTEFKPVWKTGYCMMLILLSLTLQPQLNFP